MTSSVEKQPEVTGCDASIMRDVWEIRLREYGQKTTTEKERMEKSALETINQDWQKRMTSKEKHPKRLERKPKPVETTEEQGYLSRERGRGGGYPKMAVAGKGQLRGEKLQRLISLTWGQPSSMVWAKSWKFSKPTPQQEGAAPPSNWGLSWQFMTLQPHIEGKPWPQHNGPKSHLDTYSLCEKPLKIMDPQHFQHSLPVPEWEKSWKYTKSDIKLKSETKDGSAADRDQEAGGKYSKTRMLDMLVESQHHNEALSSSEWNESWKSTKPPIGGEALAEKPVNVPANDLKKDGKSGSRLPESWRFINKQLHVNERPNQTSNDKEWAGSWKAAMMVSNNNKKAKSCGQVYDFYDQLEPLESHCHKVIMLVSREQKYRDLWSSQLRDEKKLMTGWDNSWETTKNLSEPSSEAITKAEKPKVKQQESKKSVVKVPSKKLEQTEGVQNIVPQKTLVSNISKYTQLMSPLFASDLPREWKEAWKFPKPQSSKQKNTRQVGHVLPDACTVLKQRTKNWSESWKCARVYHVKPSATEWKESWHSRYEPHEGREHSAQQPKHEVFNLPKRTTADKMSHHVKHMEKGLLSPREWLESWKSLKHQKRTENLRNKPRRSRLFREPVTAERPPSEWSNSWRFTNLTLNQESGLWQQGWSNMPRARPNRAVDQHRFTQDEAPRNGPIGARGWNTSWRFSRREHRMEAEQRGPSTHVERLPPRGGRTVGDWEESWMVSNTQSHHDRPSMTEWTESWRCSVFHTDRWGEEQPKQNWRDKSLDIITSREKLQVKTAMTKIGRSFDSQLLKDLQYTHYNGSWKTATLQRHHYKSLSVLDKSKSRCFHLKNPKSREEWIDSWKFLCINFSQHKEAWDERCLSNTMQHQVNSPYYSESNAEHNIISKWGKSWKISNPMPHIEKGSWLGCHNNRSQYVILWSRSKVMKHLYASLNKETATLRLWGKSWRFCKIEGKADSKSGKGKSKESKDGLEIMTERIKTRKYIYSQIDKDKPAERRWVDSHKLAKTQPRPKKDTWLKMPTMRTEEGMAFAQEWAASWRFSNQPQKIEVKVCLKAWEDSWKFFLGLYPQQKESKTRK